MVMLDACVFCGTEKATVVADFGRFCGSCWKTAKFKCLSCREYKPICDMVRANEGGATLLLICSTCACKGGNHVPVPKKTADTRLRVGQVRGTGIGPVRVLSVEPMAKHRGEVVIRSLRTGEEATITLDDASSTNYIEGPTTDRETFDWLVGEAEQHPDGLDIFAREAWVRGVRACAAMVVERERAMRVGPDALWQLVWPVTREALRAALRRTYP